LQINLNALETYIYTAYSNYKGGLVMY
jgi:hypothetical protein